MNRFAELVEIHWLHDVTVDTQLVAGDEVAFLGPEEFAAYWRAEYETFRDLGRLFRRP